MLFLDGVYIERPDGSLRFRWVKAPTSAELAGLTQTLARRIGRFLERQGLLERDAENSYLAGDDLEAGPMEQLLGSSITYRIAVGPQRGDVPRLSDLKDGAQLTFTRVFLVGIWPGLALLAGALLVSGIAALALGPLRTLRVLMGGAGVLGGVALVVAAPGAYVRCLADPGEAYALYVAGDGASTLDLELPALFVQGTRDNLCPLDLLEQTLAARAARSVLHVVETGNHSLEATKTYLKQSGRSQDELEEEALSAIARFVASL